MREHAADSPRRGAFRRLIGGIGWLLSGPADWAGTRSIGRGAVTIRGLTFAARSSSPDNGGNRTTDERFDLPATAFLQGVTVAQLKARLAARRRRTAAAAYACWGLGCVFTLILVRTLLWLPWMLPHLLSVIWFVPFCLLFFLVGFYQALLNFQLRTARLATWRDYLTSTAFWPR